MKYKHKLNIVIVCKNHEMYEGSERYITDLNNGAPRLWPSAAQILATWSDVKLRVGVSIIITQPISGRHECVPVRAMRTSMEEPYNRITYGGYSKSVI